MTSIADLLPIVERVAKDAYYTLGIEQDEAAGFLSVELVERANDYLILYREGHIGIIETRFMNVAKRHAKKLRIQRQVDLDQYYYEPEYVRLFLPFFFDYEDWDNGPIPDDASAEWRTAEAIDTALDVKDAWSRLKPWARDLIAARFFTSPDVDGSVDWSEIARGLGRKNAESAQSSYRQATRDLTVEMNDVRVQRINCHEGPGARHAVSNASARAMASN